MYLDSFMEVAYIKDKNIAPVLSKLEKISEQFSVDFIISISIDGSELSEDLKSKVIVSL